jgi:hypothetical protein
MSAPVQAVAYDMSEVRRRLEAEGCAVHDMPGSTGPWLRAEVGVADTATVAISVFTSGFAWVDVSASFFGYAAAAACAQALLLEVEKARVDFELAENEARAS